MLLSVELHGRVIERDTDKLPEATKQYLWQTGVSQRLRDSYASCTEKKYPDATERETARNEKIDEVLNQFDTGDVPGFRAPASPETKAWRSVANAAKEAGVDVTKIDPAKLIAWLERQSASGRAV